MRFCSLILIKSDLLKRFLIVFVPVQLLIKAKYYSENNSMIIITVQQPHNCCDEKFTELLECLCCCCCCCCCCSFADLHKHRRCVRHQTLITSAVHRLSSPARSLTLLTHWDMSVKWSSCLRSHSRTTAQLEALAKFLPSSLGGQWIPISVLLAFRRLSRHRPHLAKQTERRR